MSDLTARLASSEPSRENDLRIHAAIQGGTLFSTAHQWLWEWKDADGGTHIVNTKNLPRYTSSLDAKVPGENIVSVTRAKGEGWQGWFVEHDCGSNVLVEGTHPTSEATARRIAGLLAREKE